MLLSRFWYFILAVACGIAFSAALLTQAAFNRQYDSDLNDQLRRDRFELELMLKMDARSRIDAIAPIAAHPDVRRALRTASRRNDRGELDSRLRSTLEDKLRGLNRQLGGMQGDLLFAVDDEGYIVAQLGASPPPAGAGLGAFPLVSRALAGYVRDDTWVYNGRIYRMAARPVIDSGQYVGAIVHGMDLNDELARRLAERITGATVAFFHNDEVVASYMPQIGDAARAEDIEGPLAQALDDEKLRRGDRTDPIDMGNASRGVYSLVTGSASHAGVGYAIARPRHRLASVWDIFDLITIDDVDALPASVLAAVVGGSVLLFLLGMFFLWVERDRPFGKLERATVALGKREIDRLTITDFGGGYRKIAEQVNEAIDKAVESAAAASPKRKAADLDEILGPTPAGGGGSLPPFFGFAERPDADGKASEIPPVPPVGPGSERGGAPKLPGGPPPRPAGAPPPPPAGGPPHVPAGAPPTPSGLEPPGAGMTPPGAPKPHPAASARKPPPPPKPPAPGGAAGAAPSGSTPGVDDRPGWAKGTLLGVAGVGGRSGGAGPVQQPKAPTTAPEDLPEEDDEEQGATMVAAVPRELLEAASGEQATQDADEQHFREVYEQFVQTKKECGESTAGLAFDRFVQTLRKNRDQIVQRHGARTVRFTVYKKDGRAALKATPVKD